MTSITELPQIIASLDPIERARFERLFDVWPIDSTCTCPDEMHAWATQRFKSLEKVESQTVIRVHNLWTHEGALFNPLRSSRPRTASDEDLLDTVQPPDARRRNCPLCKPEQTTPFDSFGRIRGGHCVTACNVAKYDGKHGLVIFSEHDPLKFTRDSIVDSLRVAARWFDATADPANGFSYPFLMWNCRWRAGASLEHGHMQITMAKDRPYPKLTTCQLAAGRYRDQFGRDYFQDLYRAHEQIGLGIRRGEVRLLVSICPFRDRETLIYGPRLNDELAAVVYEVLDTYRAHADLQSFNLGLLLPPIDRGPKWQDFPAMVRIIDRLSVGELGCDISGLSVFAGIDAIATDPYTVIGLFDRQAQA
jgi:hypothetical protein